MELVVRKADLLRELQLFQGIVERKNTIPILANVLIEATDGEVKLLATDLEVGLRSRCAATVTKRGSLTLPANLVYHGRRPFAMPSIAQSRISAGLCTESFQRYGSSSPTLKMPTIGLRPSVARNSLPRFPFAHGTVTPRRA